MCLYVEMVQWAARPACCLGRADCAHSAALPFLINHEMTWSRRAVARALCSSSTTRWWCLHDVPYTATIWRALEPSLQHHDPKLLILCVWPSQRFVSFHSQRTQASSYVDTALFHRASVANKRNQLIWMINIYILRRHIININTKIDIVIHRVLHSVPQTQWRPCRLHQLHYRKYLPTY